jgi:hypothetical protein
MLKLMLIRDKNTKSMYPKVMIRMVSNAVFVSYYVIVHMKRTVESDFLLRLAVLSLLYPLL